MFVQPEQARLQTLFVIGIGPDPEVALFLRLKVGGVERDMAGRRGIAPTPEPGRAEIGAALHRPEPLQVVVVIALEPGPAFAQADEPGCAFRAEREQVIGDAVPVGAEDDVPGFDVGLGFAGRTDLAALVENFLFQELKVLRLEIVRIGQARVGLHGH